MLTSVRALFKNTFIMGFGMLFLMGCNRPSDATLTKASRAELLEMHRSGEVSLDQAVIQKANGKKVDREDVQKLKEGILAGDYYLDSHRIIRQVIVRPANFQDRITSILIRNIGYNPREGISLLDINCDSLKYTISELSSIEASVFGGEIPDTMGQFDVQRTKVVSLVENCGFPTAETLGEKGFVTFWLMVQHNGPELMAYYYPAFEQAVENGDLKARDFALMTDRLLVFHNYPQVYGSQILNWELYPIENPDSVDFRRASIGLEPLEEYLKNFDLD